MIQKTTIIYTVFTMAVLYIMAPWFFEKTFLVNEILSATGLLLLAYRRFRIGSDTISILLVLLLLLGLTHAITSLFRMDSIYYYFRNTVIIYSMAIYFIGYFWLDHLGGYIARIRRLLRVYIGIFLFIPLPRYLFERFGMAMLFPALFRRVKDQRVFMLLIAINIIYGFTYNSLTALVLAAFYILLLLSPGYKFFSQVITVMLLLFTVLFIYLVPYLGLIRLHYNFHDANAIHQVMRSNPILSIDGNNTWRMVLWRQIIVDDFPWNIPGLGFGTRALNYYPIEDISKLANLPYVLGAHNSFIYLFGRLGIFYVLLIIPVYICVFREYFYHKAYYSANNQVLIFWSFFAITIIAAFNPTLESPIYSGAYWLLLGFTARCIRNRIFAKSLNSPSHESPVYT